VPERNGHSEAVFMRLENPATRESLMELLQKTHGVSVISGAMQ